MSLIAVSDGIANELSTHFPCLRQLITVIPNGVDLDRFTPDSKARAKVRRELGLGPDTFTALFVGGDWNRKGLQHVIDSLALSPLAELIVVGRGDQPRFESLARAKGVLSRVHFVGRQEEVQRYYAAADVFVLPSAYEAFPLVVLEAAASGLPLLVTQVHGASEITEDGVTGFRVDPEPSDIGLRLNDLAADPERRARMGAAARSRVSGHSWQHVVDSYSAAADRLGTRAAWEISDREERSQITPKT